VVPVPAYEKVVPVMVAVSVEARPLLTVTVGLIDWPNITVILTTEIESVAFAEPLCPRNDVSLLR
jgi:hypothetical protein